MANPKSDTLSKIIKALQNGEQTAHEIASRIGCCHKTVDRLVRVHHKEHGIKRIKRGGGRPMAYALSDEKKRPTMGDLLRRKWTAADLPIGASA